MYFALKHISVCFINDNNQTIIYFYLQNYLIFIIYHVLQVPALPPLPHMAKSHPNDILASMRSSGVILPQIGRNNSSSLILHFLTLHIDPRDLARDGPLCDFTISFHPLPTPLPLRVITIWDRWKGKKKRDSFNGTF